MVEQKNTADAAQSQELLNKPVRKRPGRSKFFRTAAGKRLLAQFKTQYSGRSQAKNLGRTGPGRSEALQAVPDWEVAKRLTRGVPVEGMKKNAAETRGRSFGLSYGTVFFCDQGEPFTDGDLQSLRERCGFTTSGFEQIVGLPARSTDRRHAGMVRDPETVRSIVEWRDRTIRALLQESNPSQKYERVLKTLLPKLRDVYGMCFGRFTDMQKAMLVKEDTRIWTLNSVGNFVCERARHDAKNKSHAGDWGWFLRYLTELDACNSSRTFLEANLKSLKRSIGVAGFVRELLGRRYGTTRWTVNRALSKKLKPIPAAEMCGLILSPRQNTPPVQTAQKPGRPARDIYPEADRLQRENGLTWRTITQMLDPKGYKHNPESAQKAIEQGVRRLRRQ
jgi:hypothetical protein